MAGAAARMHEVWMNCLRFCGVMVRLAMFAACGGKSFCGVTTCIENNHCFGTKRWCSSGGDEFTVQFSLVPMQWPVECFAMISKGEIYC